MSPEENAFLRAAVSCPQDDLPFLMYADWLDDRGQTERAEYLRLAVEWNRVRHDSKRKKAWPNRRRLADLAADPKLQPPAGATADQCDSIPWYPTRYTFHHHFYFMEGAQARFSVSDHTAWRIHFHTRRLYLWGPGSVGRLVASPAIASVVDLRLAKIRIETSDAVAVAESALLAGLVRLDLSSCYIDAEGIDAIRRSTKLQSLRFFEFRSYSNAAEEWERLRPRYFSERVLPIQETGPRTSHAVEPSATTNGVRSIWAALVAALRRRE